MSDSSSRGGKPLCGTCRDIKGQICDSCGNGLVPDEERRVPFRPNRAAVGVVAGRLRQWAEDRPENGWFDKRFSVVARAELRELVDELEGLVPERKGEEK